MVSAIGGKPRIVKPRRCRSVRLLGTVRRRRSALMVSTALQATVVLVLALPSATPARAQPAPNARPAGGQVVAGTASISQSPSTTTITQSTQRAAVNWQSFNIGAQQSVQFQQPSASAATLNRVTGPNPSQIAGRIDANGQVILVNQDGITFYKGAQVNAAGLVASAAGMTNKNFMAGRMVFDQAAHPNARVENQGNITVRQAGLAALVAPQVANSGVITAKLGHVVLAGASAATLDLYGDGLVSIDVTKQVTKVPVGPDGKPVTALVTNTGTILADGGTVQLTAQAADGIVQNLVTAGGRISADTAGGRAGVVALNGIGGSIAVSGQLTATGDTQGVRGGRIEVVTNRGVTIAGTARLDASGRAGGGTVAVGTTLARAERGPSIKARRTASNVTVQAGASIAANATGKGNGGRIAVLSAGATQMDGAISATGGPRGGDGGFVEVSGDTLGLTGSVDLSAPQGQSGTILLDPGTLDIISGREGSFNGSFSADGTLAFDTGGTTVAGTVTNLKIDSLGTNAHVVLQATTLLDVQASVSVANGLTLQSGNSLIVEPGVSILAGTTLLLGSGIVFPAGTVGATGTITLGAAGEPAVSLSAGTLILQGGSTGGIALNNSVLSAGLVDISTAGGSVSQLDTGGVQAGTLQSASGIAGDATLIGAGNTIGTLGSMQVGGDLTLVNSGNLSVNSTVSATNINIANSGSNAINVTGTLAANPATGTLTLASGTGGIALNSSDLSANTVDLSAVGGGVSQLAGGTISAPGTLQSTAGINGGATLIGTANTITTLGTMTVGGDLTVVDSGSLTVSGPVTATNIAISNGGTQGIHVPGTLIADVQGGTLALASGTGGIALQGNSELAANIIDLSAAGGGVSQAATGSIIAPFGTLQSTSGIIGGATLIGTANTIATLGTMPVSGDLTLVDAGNLTVAGPATATNIEISNSGTDSIIVAGSLGAALLTGTLALTSGSGGIVISNDASTPLQGHAIRFDGGDGTIALDEGAVVNAGTAGSLVLAHATTAIEDITAKAVAGTLSSTGVGSIDFIGTQNAITTTNDLAAETGNLTLFTDSALATGGTVSAAADMQLTAGNGNLDIGGLVNAGTVSLFASGQLDEPTGSVAAQFLATASAGTNVLLTNVANQIGTIGGVTAAAEGAVIAGSATGTVTLTGNSTAQTLLFANSGTTEPNAILLSNATMAAPRISLVGDQFARSGENDIDAGGSLGVIEVAPFNDVGVTLGGVSDTAGAALAAIAPATGTLVVGAYHDQNNDPITTAASITVADTIDLSGIASTLALMSNGTVNEIQIISPVHPPTTAPILVSTLTGTAAAFSLLSADNQIGTLAALDAMRGNIGLVDGQSLAVAGAVSAPGGNVFLEDQAAGGMALANVVSAQNGGTISIATNALTGTAGVGLLAPGGTVEIAPFATATAVTLAGGGGLGIDSLTLGSVRADMLDIGAFHDAVNAGAITLTAGAITIDNLALGTADVPVLRLDAGGAITQAGSILSVATFSAGTHGQPGDVTLNGSANTITVLGNIAVALGDLSLTDTGPLTEPASSTVYAENVAISSQGSIDLAGNLAASAGTIAVTTIGAHDITVGNGLIGATGGISLISGGAFDQSGGTINGSDITVSAANGVVQSGGILFGFDTAAADTGVAITASGGGFTQTGGEIASNDQIDVTTQAGSLVPASTIIGVGGVTLASAGAFASSGTVLSGADLDVSGSSLTQTASTLAAVGTAALITPGIASQTGGIVAGTTVNLVAGTIQADGFQDFAGALAPIQAGSASPTQIISGITFAADVADPPVGTLTLPVATSPAGIPHELRIEVDNGGYNFNGTLAADWIDFHTLGDFTEDAGGMLNATLLSGTAGYSGPLFTTPSIIASVNLATSANDVSYLASGTAPLLATGNIQLNDTGTLQPVNPGTLIVAGSVQAGSSLGYGKTIDLAAANLVLDQSGVTVTPRDLTIAAAGSLSADATISGATTVTPGEVLLAADGLRLLGTATVVSAPAGLVAIAPLTPGNTISIVGTLPGAAPVAGTLAAQDLGLIDTLGGALGVTPGPLGTETLVLGSLDNGTASIAAGGIAIDAPLNLGTVASTLALFAAGPITQGTADPITVPMLTGAAGVLTNGSVVGNSASSLDLTALNAIGTIGNTNIQGSVISTATGQGGLLATGGISVHGDGDLLVRTLVHAGDDPTLAFTHPTQDNVPTEIADLEAAPAGAGGPGTLTVAGTVWAGIDGRLLGQVNLSGGSSSTLGAVLVQGAVFASNGGAGVATGGTVSLAAGFSSGTYNALCSAADCGIGISGVIWGNQGFGHTDPDLAALVQVNAASSIDESLGTLGAVLLSGGAGGFAGFSGGPASAASQNWIVSLGSFDSNLLFDLAVTGTLGPGLLLRDGRVPATGPALSVVGTVQDHGTAAGGNGSDGLQITVAPTADAIADLALQAGTLIADGVTGTVDIEATGNVYETGASIAAAALIAQAGAVPSTELGGNIPGTIPTNPLARASVWLGNLNQIGTLADATATQEFLLDNGPSLLIPTGGTVLAGAAPAATVAANTDGTPIIVNANPTAVVDVSNGDLTIGGIVHAGIDGSRTGNDLLTAGDVFVTGGVYAAASGNVGIAATTGSIEIPGTIWGDGPPAAGLAGAVSLTAITQIDEPGQIGATLLTGSSGWHASLTGANPDTGNQIINLGSFTSDTSTGDPSPGFELHDGSALTVTGPVQDARGGVTLAVAPTVNGNYAVADLNIANPISAATIADLQATGNVYETGSGIISAPILIAQAGAVPGTETGGNTPGTIPTNPLARASVWLGNLNQIGTLADATATQEFLLDNGPSLIVPIGGTVLAGAAPAATVAANTDGTPIVVNANPTTAITITNGDLTIGGVVHAGLDGSRTGNDLLTAGNVFVNGGVYAATSGNVGIAATTGSIEIPGTIWGDGPPGSGTALAGTVLLTAITRIDEPGQIGATLLTGSSGWHASLTGANPHTGNQIINLGSFTSDTSTGDPSPGFELHDGSALTVTGPVQDARGGVTLAVAPTVNGNYAVADLNIANPISAATIADLQATGNVYETGSGIISAPILIAQAGAVPSTETGGNIAGTIPTNPLARASVWLGNLNQIGTLADATATQEFLLDNGPSLLIPTGGTVLAGGAPAATVAANTDGTPIIVNANPTTAITITNGDLTIGGVVHAGIDGSRTGNVALTATNLALSGTAIAAAAGTLTATAGNTFVLTGTADSGTALLAGGTIDIAGTVNASNSTTAIAGGALTLNGVINTGIAALTGGSIGISGLLNASTSAAATASGPLTLQGAINTGAATLSGASVDISGVLSANNSAAAFATGPLTVEGVIATDAATLSGAFIDIAGRLTANTSAVATATGLLAIQGAITTGTATLSGGSMDIAGTLSAVNSLTATSAGPLTVEGAVNAGAASLNGGSITLAPAGTVSVGNLSAAASGALAIEGQVTAASASLAAAAMTLDGRVSTSQSLTLTAAGAIDENGSLVTPLLTGSAGAAANLVGANHIAQISGFSAGQTLAVNDQVNLLLSGRLAAALMLIDDNPFEITLANGAVVATGGEARPVGLVLTLNNNPFVDRAAFGGDGAYLTDFRQLGTSTVVGINGGPSILGVDATPGHNISFQDLQGLNTWLVLRISGTDTISGNVFVRSLDVLYSGVGGHANLFGTINRINGVQAAGAGNIAPARNAAYRFNNCAISSVSCVLLPALTLPGGNPLNGFSLGTAGDPNNDEDLLLPVVSDEDY